MSIAIIKTNDKYIHIRQATIKGYIECPIGGLADLSFPTSKLRRGRVQGDGTIAPTLMAGDCPLYVFEKVGE